MTVHKAMSLPVTLPEPGMLFPALATWQNSTHLLKAGSPLALPCPSGLPLHLLRTFVITLTITDENSLFMHLSYLLDMSSLKPGLILLYLHPYISCVQQCFVEFH